jgi:hypothetical protein
MPTHEPLVTREIFEAASTVGRFRRRSRSDPARHPTAHRTYLLRSYLWCDLCGRRAWGHTVKTRTYYRCTPDPEQHAHQSWYASHPPHVVVREDHVVAPLRRFFEQRIFGQSRRLLLAHSTDPDLEVEGVVQPALLVFR